jgi:hypothetical protein
LMCLAERNTARIDMQASRAMPHEQEIHALNRRTMPQTEQSCLEQLCLEQEQYAWRKGTCLAELYTQGSPSEAVLGTAFFCFPQ